LYCHILFHIGISIFKLISNPFRSM
jgi:hypothetical protein